MDSGCPAGVHIPGSATQQQLPGRPPRAVAHSGRSAGRDGFAAGRRRSGIDARCAVRSFPCFSAIIACLGWRLLSLSLHSLECDHSKLIVHLINCALLLQSHSSWQPVSCTSMMLWPERRGSVLHSSRHIGFPIRRASWSPSGSLLTGRMRLNLLQVRLPLKPHADHLHPNSNNFNQSQQTAQY